MKFLIREKIKLLLLYNGKENIITQLQKLYSSPTNLRSSNKSPALFLKKPLCMGNLSPSHKIFIERPANLIKNAYLQFLINKVIKKYLDYKFSSNQNQLKHKFDIHYFKLSYINNFSHHIKNKLSKLCKEFCKENFNIKLVFSSFKIKIILNIKTQFLMIWNIS